MKLQKNYSQIIDLTIILALIITLGLIFLIFQDLVITNPISPWHDELWNLYASTEFFNRTQNLWSGCNQGMCLSIMGYKFPVLSGSYHGIIKSFLFLPIVMLYKIELIRIANIVLYFSPLFYIIKQKKYFGKIGCELIAVSYFFLFIPLTLEAVFDQGQFIIPRLFFLIAAIELVKEIHNHDTKRIILIILVTSLGLYEKLTNLPIAIPIYICVALILINKDKKQVIKYAGLIGLIFVPYLITLGKNFTQFHTSLGAENLGYSKNLFIVFENFYDFIFCQNYTLSILFAKKINVVYPLIACLIIGLTLFLSIFISAKIKYKYESLVILLIPVLSLLSYPFFEGLYRPWHFYTLTSLMLIPITFLNSVKIDSHIYLKKLLILLILCLAIVNLNTTFRNIYNNERARPFNQDLLKTANQLKDLTTKNIVCLDYSVCYNMIMVTNKDYKLLAEYSFTNKVDICKNIDSLKDHEYLLITHNILNQTVFSFGERGILYDRSNYFNEKCLSSIKGLEAIKNISSNEYSIYLHKK